MCGPARVFPGRFTMTSRNTLGRKAILCAVAATLGAIFQTQATTIQLTFDTSPGNLPSFDPDASKLQVLANAAKAKWLNLLPESGHNYAVNVHYGPLGGNTLGLYNDFDHTITIDNDASEQWYLDSDPTTDSEFGNFQQILYRGIPSDLDKNSLHGDVPSL